MDKNLLYLFMFFSFFCELPCKLISPSLLLILRSMALDTCVISSEWKWLGMGQGDLPEFLQLFTALLPTYESTNQNNP